MATQITSTKEMYLELADSTGEYTRVLRIPNPKVSYNSATKADINAIIEPTFFPERQSDSPGNREDVAFFYDDYDKTRGLTQLKSVSIVTIQKTVNELA